MTTQTEQTKKVNGKEYGISELVELTGLTEQTIKSTPLAALEGLVQAQEKAKKAASKQREKETLFTKFCKKIDSKMGTGVKKYLEEIEAGKTLYDRENDFSTTDTYMADRYGPVVLAVLYQYNALKDEWKQAVEARYPDTND